MRERATFESRRTNAEGSPKAEGGIVVPDRVASLRLRNTCVMRHASCVIISALLLSITTGPAQQTNAPARLNYDAFRMISDRNIFNPNRVARGAPRTARSATTPAAHVESFSLVGIMSYEKGLFAFFEGTSADFKKVLQADAGIGQYKLASVMADMVKLSSGTNVFELKVGMQMRREDEGEWFLSATGEGSARRRVAFSRTLTNGEPVSLTTTNGTDVAGNTSEPEVIVVESETAANSPEGEAPPGNAATAAGTTTDPVLLRLMQRRQEMNQ